MSEPNYRRMYEELVEAVAPSDFMDKRTLERVHEDTLVAAKQARAGLDRAHEELVKLGRERGALDLLPLRQDVRNEVTADRLRRRA